MLAILSRSRCVKFEALTILCSVGDDDSVYGVGSSQVHSPPGIVSSLGMCTAAVVKFWSLIAVHRPGRDRGGVTIYLPGRFTQSQVGFRKSWKIKTRALIQYKYVILPV